MKDLYDSHKQQLSRLIYAQIFFVFESEFDVKLGVMGSHKEKVIARIAGFAEEVEPIRDALRAAFTGPWTLDLDLKIVKIHTKCFKGYRLKRWTEPIKPGRIHLSCDVCGRSIKLEDGYYNCA